MSVFVCVRIYVVTDTYVVVRWGIIHCLYYPLTINIIHTCMYVHMYRCLLVCTCAYVCSSPQTLIVLRTDCSLPVKAMFKHTRQISTQVQYSNMYSMHDNTVGHSIV